MKTLIKTQKGLILEGEKNGKKYFMDGITCEAWYYPENLQKEGENARREYVKNYL